MPPVWLAKNPEICYKSLEISGFLMSLRFTRSDTISREVWGKLR
jgi:hypothetical protein